MRGNRSLLLAEFLVLATPTFAAGWNGTWAGNWDNNGDGVQIIMAGNDPIGFYFHGDYLDTNASSVSKDGNTLTFTFAGGSITLTRNGATAAHALIHQKGKPDLAFDVKKDD